MLKYNVSNIFSICILLCCLFLDSVLPTSTPDDRPRRWQDGIRNHVTGCARSEGYYFISKREKLRYLRDELSASEEFISNNQVRNSETVLLLLSETLSNCFW